jgi:hypothetical protein
VTIDTAVAGLRERDFRNGAKELVSGGLARLPYLPQFLARPGWLISYLRDGGLMQFPNVMLPDGPMPYTDVTAALAAACVTWRDLHWIREAWGGPIIIKGVHRGDDAKRAVDEGAAAVVVSNHGGRQLDGVHATIRVLPEVVAAVGGRAEVLLDGGVRRGADAIKAVCLGARAVLIARTPTAGRRGSGARLEILRGRDEDDEGAGRLDGRRTESLAGGRPGGVAAWRLERTAGTLARRDRFDDQRTPLAFRKRDVRSLHGGLDQRTHGRLVEIARGCEAHVAHDVAGPLQQPLRIRQRRSVLNETQRDVIRRHQDRHDCFRWAR